jgi:hypothetical protein
MRRQAAAVPASKARIGTIYAVERHGKLTRFRVNKVTTHRVAENGSPHDYESEITGDFILGADESGRYQLEKAVLDPRRLLGQFEEYQELVAQKNAEVAIQTAKTKAEQKIANDLVALFYDLTGLPKPNERFGQPFEAKYNHGVEMSKEGARALLEKLRELQAKSQLQEA